MFSLSVGGIFTPIILTRLPNVDVKSTIMPRVSISQGYAAVLTSSGLLALTYLLATQAVQWNAMFNGDEYVTLTSAMAILAIVAISWGLINSMMFLGKDVEKRFESGMRVPMLIVSTINLILGTITLVWIIFMSILNILAAISEMFNRNNGFLGTLLNSMYLGLRIALQMFIIYTAWHCIIGIWKNENFEYKRNENLASKQEQYAASTN
ncbi:hypothetical protein SCLARK_00509 [Spiroplasma clarkii]|uniref:hypothetical protein n=1 Tax=Spiroplasma clarkii TaxID=2139 RepID=UPI000B556C6B|nr:hypothetical protein [Spiroplasma clarkii]ARU91203.1 hypothetical protein SCLARK_00509 [Spiroplasma clarkii]